MERKIPLSITIAVVSGFFSGAPYQWKRSKLTERKTPLYSTSRNAMFTEALPSNGCALHSWSRSERFLVLRVIEVFTKALPSNGFGLHSRSANDRFFLRRVIAVITEAIPSDGCGIHSQTSSHRRCVVRDLCYSHGAEVPVSSTSRNCSVYGGFAYPWMRATITEQKRLLSCTSHNCRV
jgi:hypothetical protein